MEVAQTTLNISSSKIDEMEVLRKRGYEFRGVIGEGSYSKVKRAYSSQVGHDVAVKIIVRNRAPQVFREKFLPREIESNGALSEFDGRYITHDVIRGVAYLHRHNIAHRDIKCENVLLDTSNEREGLGFVAKLCDFGFARRIAKVKVQQDLNKQDLLTDLSQTYCGSAAYAAPEVLQRQAYDSRSADVWAIGVVVFITLYGAMPYDDADIGSMIEIQRRDRVPTAQKKISRAGREIIKAILKYDPSSRPKVDKLLGYRWFYVERNKLVE